MQTEEGATGSFDSNLQPSLSRKDKKKLKRKAKRKLERQETAAKRQQLESDPNYQKAIELEEKELEEQLLKEQLITKMQEQEWEYKEKQTEEGIKRQLEEAQVFNRINISDFVEKNC